MNGLFQKYFFDLLSIISIMNKYGLNLYILRIYMSHLLTLQFKILYFKGSEI